MTPQFTRQQTVKVLLGCNVYYFHEMTPLTPPQYPPKSIQAIFIQVSITFKCAPPDRRIREDGGVRINGRVRFPDVIARLADGEHRI